MKTVGIDLGACEIVTATEMGEKLFREASYVALDRESGAFLGIGEDAERRARKESDKAIVHRIFEERIVVPSYTKAAIAHSLMHVGGSEEAHVFMSVPCSFEEVEESALAEIAIQAGASDVHFVYSPLAALAGNELDPRDSGILVDIGAARTDVMILCHGRIFYKNTYAAAGSAFDRAIAEYLLRKHKVRISLQSAEQIKQKIGTVWVGREKKYVDVRGRDAKSGECCSVRICSEEMFTALEEPMAALIEAVCDAITRIPSDGVQEVFDTGILLCGGGCLLDGLDKMISGVTGVNAMRLRNPCETVAMGLASLHTKIPRAKDAGTLNISRYFIKNAVIPQEGMFCYE